MKTTEQQRAELRALAVEYDNCDSDMKHGLVLACKLANAFSSVLSDLEEMDSLIRTQAEVQAADKTLLERYSADLAATRKKLEEAESMLQIEVASREICQSDYTLRSAELRDARKKLGESQRVPALPDASYIANAIMKEDEGGHSALSYLAIAETVLSAISAYEASKKKGAKP